MTLRHTLFTLLAIAAFVVSSCGVASKPARLAQEPAGGAAGKHILKVMSYNVHICNPPSRPRVTDLDAIVKVIRAQAPDLVALQEIDVHTQRSGPYNQAQEIARQLNMHFFFGKAIDFSGGSYGVAILSRYPLTDTVVHKLPTQEGTNGEPRVMATAKVTLPDGTAIRFGSTHLDAQGQPVNRNLQAEEIIRISTHEKLPFILAGDLNASPGSEEIALLDKHFTRTCQSCEPTFPVVKPDRTIDFITFAPATKFKVVSHEVIQEHYASDHLPVVATLEF
jgi:endonuclease/exonuclease/phosphatase family metal-dependent hydrolase